jgi:hypothetical protein
MNTTVRSRTARSQLCRPCHTPARELNVQHNRTSAGRAGSVRRNPASAAESASHQRLGASASTIVDR